VGQDFLKIKVVLKLYTKNGRWIYNYLCNQCLSPLTLRVRIPLMRSVLDTALCDKVFLRILQFPPPIKTDHHDITDILLKVQLNTKMSNPMQKKTQATITY